MIRNSRGRRGREAVKKGGDTYRDPAKATSNQNARPWMRPDCVIWNTKGISTLQGNKRERRSSFLLTDILDTLVRWVGTLRIFSFSLECFCFGSEILSVWLTLGWRCTFEIVALDKILRGPHHCAAMTHSATGRCSIWSRIWLLKWGNNPGHRWQPSFKKPTHGLWQSPCAAVQIERLLRPLENEVDCKLQRSWP